MLNLEPRRIKCLTHFIALHNTYRPIMFELIKVRGTVDRRKAGARTISYADDGSPQTALRMVLPSEYARARVALALFVTLCDLTSLRSNY